MFRTAKGQDAIALAALCAECIPQPWSEQAFAAEIEKGSLVFSAWEDERLIGFIVAEMQDDIAYIHLIAVDSAGRRKGTGRALISECEAWGRAENARCLMLEVRDSNETARGFYTSLGFETIARRRRFYSFPREDGLTMQKVINYENTCN